jgi:hypothetical protein
MARLFFATDLLFALILPLGAQSVTSASAMRARPTSIVFATKGNPAAFAHIVPNTCADVYSETTGVPASLGFALTDTRRQWGAPRRLDLIPDLGDGLARADGNVTVRRGNQNVTAPSQFLFRPPTPRCVTTYPGPSDTNVGRLPLTLPGRR